MLIIPAIDIKNGKCVRLIQGDPNKETIYADDPLEIAKKFEANGAKLIHVVDLDGAFSGFPVNKDIVISISKSITIPIEIGGGIRNSESVEEYLSSGIERIILGTVLINDEYMDFIDKYHNNIIVSIDAKDSMIATHGWMNVSDISATELIKKLQDLGIGEVIYTDIACDGMLKGPNFESIKKNLSELKDISLIASGGISSIEDLSHLNKYTSLGLKGCIVGKAIYDGRIDIKNAISLFEK